VQEADRALELVLVGSEAVGAELGSNDGVTGGQAGV
jgi:hypothetical protein